MENKDVQTLQYTPRPSTSLEVVRTLQSARPLSLSPLPTPFSVSRLSPSYDLPGPMSQSGGAINQPGVTAQNTHARGDGQEPGQSAGGGIPTANAGKGDNPTEV